MIWRRFVDYGNLFVFADVRAGWPGGVTAPERLWIRTSSVDRLFALFGSGHATTVVAGPNVAWALGQSEPFGAPNSESTRSCDTFGAVYTRATKTDSHP